MSPFAFKVKMIRFYWKRPDWGVLRIAQAMGLPYSWAWGVIFAGKDMEPEEISRRSVKFRPEHTDDEVRRVLEGPFP